MTLPLLMEKKRLGEPIVMVTAYDEPGARIVDAAGVDILLVGDTLAMTVLGHDDTLHVTIDDMCRHVAAVARAKPKCLVVGDMPWMSYHVSKEETIRNAAALIRADWHPTAGHHPDDIYGAHGVRRRIDGVRVTGPLTDAVRAHHVLDTAQTRQASDHLPVTVEYSPAGLRG